VLAGITWGTNNSLTLSAYRDINIAANVAITNNNNASGKLVLRADNTGRGTGTVTFAQGTTPGTVNFQNSTGTVSIYYNPSPPLEGPGTKYQNPTNFACSGSCLNGGVIVAQPSQLAAYMLVNSANDLQLVSSNLAGRY